RSPWALLLQVDGLHGFDVKIPRTGKRVGDLAGVERPLEIADGVFDGMTRFEAEFAGDLFRGNLIRAIVVGRLGHDFDFFPDDMAYQIGNVAHFEVVVTR